MPSGAREILLLLGALVLCPVAALLIGDDPAAPLARARAVAELEAAVGVHVEAAVHRWALGIGWLVPAASAFYVGAHVPVAGWALVWTWFLRRDAYPTLRTLFLWTQALTVALYVLVPTAPPRLLPDAGFTDTLTGLWGRELADSAHLLQSPFAAMPSGHVAFALAAGGAFAVLGDHRWLRVFGWIYPPLVVAVTVLTANHFLLDAVAAALVVALAAWLALRRTPATAARGRGRRSPRCRPAGPGCGPC